jgi:hypothetical protein
MQKRRMKTLLIFLVTFFLSHSSFAYSQMKKPGVRIKVEPENYVSDIGGRSLLTSCKLYTIIQGRKHFIDDLSRKAVGIPEPLVDPTGNFVVYASNTGCGFEGEGMTVFVSDVYGKVKLPVLSRCWYLRPTGFLHFQGKYYLLITQTSEGPERSFWLYDLISRDFVVHADGEIKAIRNGVFSYGYYKVDEDFKEIGNVTAGDLVNRKSPLKLLSRYPTQGQVQKKAVRVYQAFQCQDFDDERYQIINAPGTKVPIVETCDDGGYLIYWRGALGKVKRGTIRPIEFGSKK